MSHAGGGFEGILSAAPRCSWLGRLLVVDADWRLVAKEADGSNPTVLFQDRLVGGGLSVCPDGHQALFAAINKTTSSTNIWHLDLQSSDATVLTDGKQDVQPACSPDSTYFVYLSLEGSKSVLMRKLLAGGPAKRLSEKVLTMPTISPDGRQIAALATEGSGVNGEAMLEIFPADGGTPLKTFSPGPLFGYGLQFSADGQAIYYVSQNRGVGNIAVQPIAGGPPTTITKFRDKFIMSFNYDWKKNKLAVIRGTSRHDIVLITQQQVQ